MNQAYFQLSSDKQKRLLNSGYKLFASYPYKKASMIAIANEADISKSLLFYYFKNKKEYYLFLFDAALDFVDELKEKSINKEIKDFFQLINKTMERRMEIIHDYPYLYKFITIKKIAEPWAKSNSNCTLRFIDHAAHNSNQDNPEMVNKLIIDFINVSFITK
ncbi:TetR family transcriptional regulator [Clostridium folliculivorans]|uniref:HTH tetR-type domain-containing protein n=1 Tax=Clostridium folliculivorans TaxID=2886038 RepID=A0A9W5Y0K9_9CLOT|nr:TetR family transcriptional regulator [Clostridium folliculivorans]GKU24400.1 hypothetical protein CFOLD11_12260 [Clostridium folliculivorans]GKU30496.1 hypothetical protein CFB3_26030 [Clostridium folliculivorans]